MRIKKISIILITLMFASVFTSAIFSQSKEALVVARFKKGKVFFIRNGKKKKVRLKTIFYKHDIIVTKKGSVDLQIGPSAIVKVSSYTRIKIARVLQKGSQTHIGLNLRTGKVYAKIFNKLRKGSSFSIKTPTAVAGVRGTEFLISEQSDKDKNKSGNDEASVSNGVYVSEGKVSFKTDKERVIVGAGKQAVIDTHNQLKSGIIDQFVKEKLAMMKQFKLLKEANYKMLVDQKERNAAMIKMQRDMYEKAKGSILDSE